MRNFLASTTVSLFLAGTAAGSSIPPITIKADLDVSGSRIVLEVEATAGDLRDCTVEVTSFNEGLAGASSADANLMRGVPIRISIPIQPEAVPSNANLRAAVRQRGDIGAVAVFHFWRDTDGNLIEVSESDHASRVVEATRKVDAAAARGIEIANLTAALASGKKPSPSKVFLNAPNSDILPGQAAPDSPTQLAWDALVTSRQPLAHRAPLVGDCGLNRPDGNNYTIQVQGSFGYHDYYEGGTRTAFSASYPVTVDTEIEVTNDCGDIGYITRSYPGTSNAGYYSITALTRVPPGSQNPVLGSVLRPEGPA